ncbi:cobalt-zinc-cadmium resistance protein CzcC precursor [mine drainage metagenome]|uniref:Cobalt-zinc-cadmium resistance protein CzcC n=1 Tax=mine drainage metagenome TaxID=410659 RepID=A0A1J5SKB9_9ZZZZ
MNERILPMALAIMTLSVPLAWAEDMPDHTGAIGATVDELVAMARGMNPDVQVAVLEADAAAAKVEAAGSLPDPKIQWQVQQWPRDNPGLLPRSPLLGDNMFSVVQMFPFWGKRDLRRDIAAADARQASLMRHEVENEVVARVKIAYAQYHSAHLVGDLDRDLRDRMDILAKQAIARYARGQGRQEDATRAQVEKARLDTDIARTEAERAQARVAINRLLNRDLNAPLVEMPAPRPIPAADKLDITDLIVRSQSSNPQVQAQQAAIDGAQKSADLAERDWYPDFEVGFGPEQMGDRLVGYNAMISATIPLQWGLHDSQISEAKARASASRTKREAIARDVEESLTNSWISLKSSRQVETLLRDNQLPQAKIGFESVANAYALGQSNFVDVLTAEQQLWTTDIDLIKVRFDQQMRLAEIERLIGGDL